MLTFDITSWTELVPEPPVRKGDIIEFSQISGAQGYGQWETRQVIDRTYHLFHQADDRETKINGIWFFIKNTKSDKTQKILRYNFLLYEVVKKIEQI